MFLYKSSTNRTVVSGRYQVNAEPGVLLELEDKDLDALVAEGSLSVETVTLEVEETVVDAKKAEPVKPIASK